MYFTHFFSSLIDNENNIQHCSRYQLDKASLFFERVGLKHTKGWKEHFLNQTIHNIKHKKTCKVSRKSSFSSYVQQYNRKNLNQRILCPFDARRLAGERVIVQLRAVSVHYLSFVCEKFSGMILDSSNIPLFHSGQVFHELVCPVIVSLPPVLLLFSCTSWCCCSRAVWLSHLYWHFGDNCVTLWGNCLSLLFWLHVREKNRLTWKTGTA